MTYKISYVLADNNTFTIRYEAVSTKDTVLTITNHSYFNLSGNLKETILDHEITLDSGQFVELDDELIQPERFYRYQGQPLISLKDGQSAVLLIQRTHKIN